MKNELSDAQKKALVRRVYDACSQYCGVSKNVYIETAIEITFEMFGKDRYQEGYDDGYEKCKGDIVSKIENM
jgi:hypothetical protein